MRRLLGTISVLAMTAALVGAPPLTVTAVADATPVMPGAGGDPTMAIGGVSDATTQAQRGAAVKRTAGAGGRAAGGSVAEQNAAENGVYPVGTGLVDAQVLATAAYGPGWVSSQYVTTPPTFGTNAITDNLGGFSNDGTSALLTTGKSAWAGEPNLFDSSSRDSGGGVVRGQQTFDVTILKITFDVAAGANCLSLNFRFYSEEAPEFTNRGYNDAFLAELDTDDWSTVGTTVLAPHNFAKDQRGNLVSVNNSGAVVMSDRMAVGTTYDAATPVMVAQTPITAGRHSLYLSIFDQYDAVYDSAVLVDNIKTETRSDCVAGIPDIPLPLIFLPGITGTYLVDRDGNETWPRIKQTISSPGDGHLDQLRLKDDGSSNCDGCTIRPDRVILHAGILLWGEDFYQPTVDFYRKAGFHYDEDGTPEPGENFFMFGFDWRRSAEINADALIAFIDRVLAVTGAPKVNLIAHSQGGLVSMAAVNRTALNGKVNRLVTLGTPYLGTAKVTGLVRYQTPCLIGKAGLCLLNTGEVQKISKNMSGMLELLPSDEYFTRVKSPVDLQYDSNGDGVNEGPVTIPQYLDLFNDTATYNRTLIEHAEQWHRTYDSWHQSDPVMGYHRIVGSGYYTIDKIAVREVQICIFGKGVSDCHLELHGFPVEGDGDGEVPDASAAIPDGRTETLSDIDHMTLAHDARSLSRALQIVRGTGPVSYDSTTLSQISAAGGHVVQAGDPPPTITGTELLVSGPALGYVTDQDGWRTGVIDPATRNSATSIPGSSFSPMPAGGGLYGLTETGTTQGRWTAIAPGEISLVFNGTTAGVLNRTVAYPRVSVVAGTVITLSAISTPLGSPPVLAVDDDGDGTVDRTVAAMPAVTGTAATDAVNPVSTATVTANGAQRKFVTLTATDTGGAGVDHIEWWYAAGQLSGVYTGTPLDLPASGSVVFRATDKAGNVEWIKTVALT